MRWISALAWLAPGVAFACGNSFIEAGARSALGYAAGLLAAMAFVLGVARRFGRIYMPWPIQLRIAIAVLVAAQITGTMAGLALLPRPDELVIAMIVLPASLLISRVLGGDIPSAAHG